MAAKLIGLVQDLQRNKAEVSVDFCTQIPKITLTEYTASVIDILCKHFILYILTIHTLYVIHNHTSVLTHTHIYTHILV